MTRSPSDERAGELQTLAAVSHEVRNALSTVIGFAALLRDSPLTPEQAEHVAAIRSAADRGLAITKRVLETAKAVEGRGGKARLERFRVSEVLQELLGEFRRAAVAKGLDLRLQADPAAAQEIVGDRLQLREVLVNLVSNAIEHTDKGRVVVSVEPGEDGERQSLSFAVVDTGSGIPRERLSSIFRPFGSAGAHGVGLGLSLSKSFVELMGGRMRVASQVGAGSTFSFVLPVDPNASAVPSTGRQKK